MRRLNSWWLLGPVVVALVLWLAQPRHGPEPAPPAPTAEASQVGDSGSIEVEPKAEEATPRHPEIGFRTRERLDQHFRKHGVEFHARSATEYLRLAQALRDHPRGGGVLEVVRNDAVTCKFDTQDGSFVAYNSDGTIRSFFRPRDGVAYFERQKTRSGDLP